MGASVASAPAWGFPTRAALASDGGAQLAKLLATAEVLALLAAAPSRIAALTADLAPTQVWAAPAPGEWSLTEILAHLRACADMWGGAIAAILAADHPTLRAVNPTTWINRTDYREQAFAASLTAYTTQRAELLTVLEPLMPDDWARAATVTGTGKATERTVRFYAQWLARHERPHLKQIDHTARTLRREP